MLSLNNYNCYNLLHFHYLCNNKIAHIILYVSYKDNFKIAERQLAANIWLDQQCKVSLVMYANKIVTQR